MFIFIMNIYNDIPNVLTYIHFCIFQPPSEQNNNVCYVNTSAFFASSQNVTSDTRGSVPGYNAPVQSTSTETDSDRTLWNRTEPLQSMETQSSTPQTSESGYGVVKRRQKVAKGVQTEEVRKRCWRHRRDSLLDKSRQNENDGTLSSRQESKLDVSSPNSSSKSVLRRALPNVNFSTWSRTSKVSDGYSFLFLYFF
ncbi:hypothetical protein AVEN_132425-1 [Araneus ventricosus]|uniref:Uncharacterized protein n=1 Tax=Araneus ventricosus TaxID=182803 RepID=A0A4Y2USP8_ARAVE|nr:hypothetical protein AVEN_132425-1 [Araneus ventricosus]